MSIYSARRQKTAIDSFSWSSWSSCLVLQSDSDLIQTDSASTSALRSRSPKTDHASQEYLHNLSPAAKVQNWFGQFFRSSAANWSCCCYCCCCCFCFFMDLSSMTVIHFHTHPVLHPVPSPQSRHPTFKALNLEILESNLSTKKSEVSPRCFLLCPKQTAGDPRPSACSRPSTRSSSLLAHLRPLRTTHSSLGTTKPKLVVVLNESRN